MSFNNKSPKTTLVYYPDTCVIKPEINVYFLKNEAENVELEREIVFNKSTP